MGQRQPIQLKLPEIAMTAVERKQWIRERLHGYEYRQAVREAKRKRAAERRKVELLEDQETANNPTQTSIPPQLYRRVP
jgi:hypothetical protein